MERNWIAALILVLLAGCHHNVKPNEAFEVHIPKESTMQPCEPPRTDYVFTSFYDVLEARVDDQVIFIKCSSRVEELQSIIQGLNNGKIIRLTTPQSERSGTETAGSGSESGNTDNLHADNADGR